MMDKKDFRRNLYIIFTFFLIIAISSLHYTTPTHIWQYHLIYMQLYFIPILLAAFRFGLKGGILSALIVTIAYLPHIMLQWGGLVETNLMRFMQIGLFNIIGFITGYLVSREKEEKEKYQKTSQELARALDEIRKQEEKLSRLEEELRQSDRLSVIGELTASFAHEIRNPLNSILGTAEILRDEAQLSEQHQEFLQIMLQEIKRVTGVIEQYLHYARKPTRKSEYFDPVSIIHSVVSLLQGSFRRKNIQYHEDIEVTDIKIKGDALGFQQILMNILMNSIQAVQEDGRISLSLKSEKDRYICKIEDNGVGIEPDIVSEVFKPFFSTRANGTGLGLAISKRIADENQWKLSLQSHPDQGTVFTIELPFNKEEQITRL